MTVVDVHNHAAPAALLDLVAALNILSVVVSAGALLLGRLLLCLGRRERLPTPAA